MENAVLKRQKYSGCASNSAAKMQGEIVPPVPPVPTGLYSTTNPQIHEKYCELWMDEEGRERNSFEYSNHVI